MNIIEQFEVHGSHREIGQAVGRRFADRIHRFLDHYDMFQTQILPFARSVEGMALYRSFLELHRNRTPGYMEELEGIAEGAERPLEEILLGNLRGEFEVLSGGPQGSATGEGLPGPGCTDCVVLTRDMAVIGHNEDGPPSGAGNMIMLKVRVDDTPTFTALCYPGFIPGNAFGFNEYGVMHTVNNVTPNSVRVGLGRHFVARSLLDASSLEEALQKAEVREQAFGFHYNLGSTAERSLVGVETSPDGSRRHVVDGYYLHTNHYLHMDLEQTITPSSNARMVRAEEMCREKPPGRVEDVLALLSDRSNREFPIHCDATPPDKNATLCTALYDLDAGRARIYWKNPTQTPDAYLECELARPSVKHSG